MAIYHLEAKVVSRGTGRSAVAASAYLSCTNILNDYDGVRHDYTRKKGLIWREVFLPEYAPPEWKDRGVLWNAVEENEKTKDSRLAREFVPALPVELTPTQWQELLSDFIKESFVADGMCADVAIHDPYPPGHNPHAHILLTVRPLDLRQRKRTDGRSSIRIRLGARKCICLPPKQRSKAWSEPASTPKAPSSADRIPSPNVGTARNSLSYGARHGQT